MPLINSLKNTLARGLRRGIFKSKEIGPRPDFEWFPLSRNKAKLLVYVGLPMVAVILYRLRTQHTDEIHPLKWYVDHPDYWSRRHEQFEKTSPLEENCDQKVFGKDLEKAHWSF
ncbi:hypothetical protein HDE_02067 [Halotydeus destructor]|nr:hypothetical protein HDE_02067 [Halotydeus destructor]